MVDKTLKQLLQNFPILFQEAFKISSFILKILSVEYAKKTVNKSHFTH